MTLSDLGRLLRARGVTLRCFCGRSAFVAALIDETRAAISAEGGDLETAVMTALDLFDAQMGAM